MQYPIFFGLSILLFVAQTAMLADLSDTIRFHDLLIPLTVYFSLYRPFREGLVVLIVSGIMMDMVSGAPIGVYLTAYLWLFVAFRRIRRWVRMRQSILFPLIIVFGVLFENAIFWIIISMGEGRFVFSANAIQILFFQLLWAVISAPILFIVFHAIFGVADRFGGGRLPENGKP